MVWLFIDIQWPALHVVLETSTDATAKVDAVDGSQAVSVGLRRGDGGKLWGFWPRGLRLLLCTPEDERQEVRVLNARRPCQGPLAQISL